MDLIDTYLQNHMTEEVPEEVLRTMTMDPSPRERAERSQKRWLPFRWEVGSDVQERA
jgi:hypothetical protein